MPREAIRMLDIPRPPKAIIEAFMALVDLTGTLSDACDELGIVAVIPAYQLPPVYFTKRIVGPAMTLRNIARDVQIHKAAQEKINTQGETEAHNLAEPGDVLVIQGVMGCSNMGGQSASIAKRQGFIGGFANRTQAAGPGAQPRHQADMALGRHTGFGQGADKPRVPLTHDGVAAYLHGAERQPQRFFGAGHRDQRH
jgi:hypothetical protein